MRSVLSFYPLIASVKILCSLFYSSMVSYSSQSQADRRWLRLFLSVPARTLVVRAASGRSPSFVTFVKSNAKALLAATPPKMQPAPNGKPFFSGFAPCRELNFRIQSVKIPLHCTDIFLPSARKSYSNLLEILLLPRKAVLSYSLLILLQSLIFSSFRHFVHYR